MLGNLRVLDLTNERGQLCGQILADLGADVTLVEPPEGSSARRLGPFAGDVIDGERSLWFWAYNRGKRSITLDIESPAGRDQLRELAAEADFLVESFTPGYLDSLGLGYDALAAINPRLIVVSISPFGATGPKANWAASDLTVMAAAGVTQLTGDEDRSPVGCRVPQSFLHASAEAAVGALIAHEARVRSGRGQHVDASAQAASMLATQSLILAHGWGDNFPTRVAGGLKLGPILLKLVNPTKDGYVSVTFLFGSSMGPFTRRLAHLMHERGFMDEASRDKDWMNYTVLLQTGQEPISELMRLIGLVAEFTKAHTKQELFDLALEKGLLIVPVTTVEDVAHSAQLADRGYWTPIDQPQLGRDVAYPGPFAKFSRTPTTYAEGVPTLGAANAQPFTRPRIAPRATDAPHAGSALQGLKVLDLMWVFAGPTASRYFADHGATVIRVESAHAIDAARTINPAKDGIAGPERAGGFINVNAGKLGISVNIGTAAGRAVIRRLANWADVLMESFSPKAMKKWGLGYDALSQENPRLIMLSSCLNGQTGPWAGLAGFGTMGAQIAGFGELAGWPDRPPAGMFGAYTDYVAPKFTAAAVLAALEERRSSGKGQYIDFSQAEASLHFIAPAFLEYAVNGRVMRRNGNASDWWAPQGLYPCQGDDRWVAVVCETEAQWRGLCSATGNDRGWLDDPRFANNAARKQNYQALDALIGAWTANRTQAEVEQQLQAAAVPCHRSATSEDAFADPQLLARGHFVEVDHGELGRVSVENARFRLSATPPVVTRGGPTMGQDNDYVLRNILGLGDEEIVELIAAGALE